MDILTQKYQATGISPDTGAFILLDGKIYTTVAGMEIQAMRSGMLAGKSSVVFGLETDAENPFSNKTINVPTTAVATYQRLVMDTPRDFSSDPVQFFEYAKKRWHFEKPFMFLAKIARACALRHAFPDIFAGVISYEEQQCELGFDAPAVQQNQSPLASQPLTVNKEAFNNIQAGLPTRTAVPLPTVAELHSYGVSETIPNIPASTSSVHDLVASVFRNRETIEVLDGPTHVHLPEGRG